MHASAGRLLQRLRALGGEPVAGRVSELVDRLAHAMQGELAIQLCQPLAAHLLAAHLLASLSVSR